MALADRLDARNMPMRALVRDCRDRLLATHDTVCLERARLVTAAFRRHEGAPRPLVRAHALGDVLRHMTLDVDSNPVFAGNTSSRPRAWMLVPEHGCGPDFQVLHENPGLDGILDGVIPADIAAFWEHRSVGGTCDPGHLAVDLETVVHQGLWALVARLDALTDRGTHEQQVYRQAMRLTLVAVIEWAERYAEAATTAAARATDSLTRRCHERVAAACRRVPAYPARTLFEGLQAIILVHLALVLEGHGMSVSVGLPDRVLEPFVSAETDAEEATDLLAAFLLKLTANSVFGRGSKTQAVTVGGADHTGRDRSNALTLWFLDAAALIRVGDPHLFLRWHAALDPRVKQRAAALLAAGLSMPLLINDEPTARGFEAAGMTREDAWRYCVVGCNELGVPGLSAESANSRAGSVQYLETLNRILLQHPDPDAIDGTGALIVLMEEDLASRLRRARRFYHDGLPRVAERAPVPFTSALMTGCIEAGGDMVDCMVYRIPCLYERGLTNAANALAAIDAVVFSKRDVTLGNLVRGLRADFGEDGAGLRQALRQAPKWGNDDPAVDAYVGQLLALRERVLGTIDAEFGDPAHVVCHVVRSLHHFDGMRIDASPDGRRAGTPVADSIGAEVGTSFKGPTAVLSSVAKIDASRYYRGGTNLNITLPKTGTDAAVVLPLIAGFFQQNGQELQINCLDAAELRDAQKHPEKHGDLVVRFAGLSSRFVDLSGVEQDELIERATAAG